MASYVKADLVLVELVCVLPESSSEEVSFCGVCVLLRAELLT